MLVSIIIPVYNKEKYLNKCIQSVVEQKYNNLEIIIINDGSNDNSGRIIDYWAKKDPRIRHVSQNNKGVAYSRNKGISIAKGDYIFFLDADDYLDKNAMTKLLKYTKKFDSDIVIGNYFEDKNGELIKKPNFENKVFKGTELNSIENLFEMFIEKDKRYMAMAGNKLYKLEFIKENGILFREKVIAEDRLFNLICYVNNPTIQLANEYTYYYSILQNSRSRAFNPNYFEENILLIKEFYNYLVENSKTDQYCYLLWLTVLYDVEKIVSETIRYTKNIFKVNIVVNKLKEDRLIDKTISTIHTELQNGNKIFPFELRLRVHLLLKKPFLYVTIKFISYIKNGVLARLKMRFNS